MLADLLADTERAYEHTKLLAYIKIKASEEE